MASASREYIKSFRNWFYANGIVNIGNGIVNIENGNSI